MSIGSLMGFIPPFLVTNYGYSLRFSYWLMLLIAVIMFFAQVPFYLLIFKNIKDEKQGNGFTFRLQSKDVVIKYSIIQIIQMIALNPFSSLLPYFVNKKFGAESDALGAIQFASCFVQAGANILGPKIAQKYGSVKTISTSLIIAAPFFALFTIAPTFFWLSIIYITRLGIASVCNPLMPSLFYKLIREEEKATANSIATMASMGTNIFTPKLGAYLIENVSIDAPALLAASLYPIYGATFYFFFKNENPLKKKTLQMQIH
jgi:predicted MFS family arabinose efflux permease